MTCAACGEQMTTVGATRGPYLFCEESHALRWDHTIVGASWHWRESVQAFGRSMAQAARDFRLPR